MVSQVLRINVSSESSTTVLHIAGELRREGVAELRRVIASISGEFVLDLSQLRFADRQGAQIMIGIGDSGAELRHASPYLMLLLDRERDDSNRSPRVRPHRDLTHSP